MVRFAYTAEPRTKDLPTTTRKTPMISAWAMEDSLASFRHTGRHSEPH
jgi:hypothetical protein